MSNALSIHPNIDMDIQTLGQTLVKSGYFQDSRDASQAIVKVLAGRELGLGPIASMTGIYIVKGRVTLSANLIAAAIKKSRHYDYRVARMDNAGCVVVFFQDGQEIGRSEFTEADAKAAGLIGGENWKKFPRNMYFARAMSNGAKWFTPDVFSGPIYTPDELGATVDGETGEAIDIEPQRDSAPQPAKKIAADPVAILRSTVLDWFKYAAESKIALPIEMTAADLDAMDEPALRQMIREIEMTVDAIEAQEEAA
jgi:hypothetical protein